MVRTRDHQLTGVEYKNGNWKQSTVQFRHINKYREMVRHCIAFCGSSSQFHLMDKLDNILRILSAAAPNTDDEVEYILSRFIVVVRRKPSDQDK